MSSRGARFAQLYDRLILGHPAAVLLLIAALVAIGGWQAQSFRLDASADALVLENDAALRYYRAIRARYGADDFLVVTYSADDLFSTARLAELGRLRDELAKLERVESVTSILDVPLIRSPPVTLAELSEHTPTLADPHTDIAQARQEFLTSPLYRNLLISPDGTTTALQVNLRRTEDYRTLLQRRNTLLTQHLQQPLAAAERAELAEIKRQLRANNVDLQDSFRHDVRAIRTIMADYRNGAELHLGGVPMIIADSIDYIRHDLIVFGAAVGLLIVLILAAAFRKLRWVVLPLLTCGAAAVLMLGLLGGLDWRVTVVSANFMALLLIITLSFTIHLLVRYRELHVAQPQATQYALVRQTVHSKALPCLYTALTTMAAFGSLLVSDIRPVIDFGWMMTIGIVVAFALSFTLFPCAALYFEPGEPRQRRDLVHTVTRYMARLVERHGNATLIVFALLAALSVGGIGLLSVENRFIDYFKDSTEIHRGMTLIDRQLGGTTPLDVIIDAPADAGSGPADNATLVEDPFAETDPSGGITATSYWFNSYRLEQANAIHASLDALDATGKVLSIATTLEMLRMLEGQQAIDDFFLSILHKRLPESLQARLIDPYLSKDGNQLRFSVRVFESDPTLDRDQLLADIRHKLVEDHGLRPEQVHLTGMLVLYNNMLHSLFRSQILTVGAVFLVILLMFILLFRNVRLALVAIVPNLFAAALVLGIMGWLGVPLDLMTITIAAISIGIAVDDTIHYVHRYRGEFAKDHNYRAALRRAHTSIGRALFYTTLTISLGFSVLALSNFVPTIYFGLFTGVAMLTALVADLTLLPLLITRFKPLGQPRPIPQPILETSP